METYIVRIHRYEEEGKGPLSVGLVEDAGSGRTSKFSGPGELLKILKIEEVSVPEKRKLKHEGRAL